MDFCVLDSYVHRPGSSAPLFACLASCHPRSLLLTWFFHDWHGWWIVHLSVWMDGTGATKLSTPGKGRTRWRPRVLVGTRPMGPLDLRSFRFGVGKGSDRPRQGPQRSSLATTEGVDTTGVDPRSHPGVCDDVPFNLPNRPIQIPFYSFLLKGETHQGGFSRTIQTHVSCAAVRRTQRCARARHGHRRCVACVPRAKERSVNDERATRGRGHGAWARGGTRRTGSTAGDGTRSDPCWLVHHRLDPWERGGPSGFNRNRNQGRSKKGSRSKGMDPELVKDHTSCSG